MSQLQKTQGATDRIREILNHEIEDHRGESGETLTGAISAKDLVFAYPSRKETQVLNGVDFEVNAGERIAIVGPSGAGKSTVFSLLLGFYEGDEGSLSFDGKDSGIFLFRRVVRPWLWCLKRSCCLVGQFVKILSMDVPGQARRNHGSCSESQRPQFYR
jgi:ABC-type bacteriocin/lantibiotic exporter with double-glycine peptidase domain